MCGLTTHSPEMNPTFDILLRTLSPPDLNLSSEQPSPSYHSVTAISLELSFKLPFDPVFFSSLVYGSLLDLDVKKVEVCSLLNKSVN